MDAGRSRDELLDGLVASARVGDQQAFARLWELLAAPVAGYVRTLGARDPDDVTSEVFLAAFRGIAGFTGDGARFRSYLFTIAHHRAVDELRARSRRGAESPYQPEDDARSADSAEQEALARLGEDTTALVERLSPEHREVLRLRILADLPVEEVARLLGRSPGAVKQLQRRALAALRRELAADAPGEATRTAGAAQRVEQLPVPAVAVGTPTAGSPSRTPRPVGEPARAASQASPARVRRSASTGRSATRWCGAA